MKLSKLIKACVVGTALAVLQPAHAEPAQPAGAAVDRQAVQPVNINRADAATLASARTAPESAPHHVRLLANSHGSGLRPVAHSSLLRAGVPPLLPCSVAPAACLACARTGALAYCGACTSPAPPCCVGNPIGRADTRSCSQSSRPRKPVACAHSAAQPDTCGVAMLVPCIRP